MLKRFGQHVRIGVASGGVAVARTNFWRPGRAEVVAERPLASHGELAGIAASVREVLTGAGARGAVVSVVLADELVRMWQVTPPPACSRLSDLQAAAALRYRTLFGASLAGWKIVADWDAVQPFMAVAAPEALLSALEAIVREHDGHVVEVVPQFVAALNQWRKLRRPGAWFGLLQSQVLTMALFDGASLSAIRSAAVPPCASREWLEGHVAREALRLGIERPERLQLCGPAPAGWISDAGQLKFACTLLDSGGDGVSDLARLACTGCAP
jgi:hypothetical protein